LFFQRVEAEADGGDGGGVVANDLEEVVGVLGGVEDVDEAIAARRG